jgi:hypothetical protein
VQRDIPRTLEALLSLLAALDEYAAALAPVLPSPEDLSAMSAADRARVLRDADEAARAEGVLAPLADGTCSDVRE